MTHSTITVTNRRLQEIAAGFGLLLARHLDAVSRQRAVYQYTAIVKPAADAMQAGLMAIQQRELEVAAISDEAELVAATLALRAESSAFWRQTVELPLPTRILRESDLPKPLKGKMRAGAETVDGTDNITDNARITALLAPEFFALVDIDADHDASSEDD